MRAAFKFASLVGVAVIACCVPTLGQSGALPVSRSFDFRNGTLGWQAGFADYTPATDQNDSYQLRAEIRSLPAELGVNGTGFYIQGNNHSDDLFMFFKRRLDQTDGIVAGQTYQITFTVVFASNAQSGCLGIGGAPGESVSLKVGASPAEPKALLTPPPSDSRLFSWLFMNIDKSNQSQSGIAASVAGVIANGQPCHPNEPSPYVSIQRTYQHTSLVNANSLGELWLLIGTDSGFEGTTALYYQRIDVSLLPVNQQPPVLLAYGNTGKAAVLDSGSLSGEPFSVSSPWNIFSPDQHTRLIIFGYNLELKAGETPQAITVQAEDSQNHIYDVPVEAVTEVPNFNWITQVTVRLSDELQGTGNVALSIRLRGAGSNKLPMTIH